MPIVDEIQKKSEMNRSLGRSFNTKIETMNIPLTEMINILVQMYASGVFTLSSPIFSSIGSVVVIIATNILNLYVVFSKYGTKNLR